MDLDEEFVLSEHVNTISGNHFVLINIYWMFNKTLCVQIKKLIINKLIIYYKYAHIQSKIYTENINGNRGITQTRIN